MEKAIKIEDIKYLGTMRGKEIFGNDAADEVIKYLDQSRIIAEKKALDLEIESMKPEKFNFLREFAKNLLK